ncbi:MAG: sensor histidine kinase [Vibrio sp.]
MSEQDAANLPSIYQKIRLRFIAFGFIFFGLFWGIIYVAESQLEVISLHHWLDTEAQHYIERYDEVGLKARLPNEAEFLSYWTETPIPNWLRSYDSPGFYEHLLGEEDKHFIVFPHPSGQGLMYLMFQDDADDYLDGYEGSLHSFTFIFGCLLTLAVSLYGYFFVRSIAKPLNQIEQKIQQMSPDMPDFAVDSPYKETRHIEQALLDNKQHIAHFFQREKEFSRFSSHELRTPIMVIKGSSDILAKVPDQPNIAKRAIKRMQLASDEMKILTETFLLLGKETIEPHHFDTFQIDELLSQELDHLQGMFAKQGASYQLNITHPQSVYAPKSFILIVINNLIKNAFSYSIGDIIIDLAANQLTITNRHDGNETFNAGYGCGLVIVERICERQKWHFDIQDDGQSFKASLTFS